MSLLKTFVYLSQHFLSIVRLKYIRTVEYFEFWLMEDAVLQVYIHLDTFTRLSVPKIILLKIFPYYVLIDQIQI